MIEVVTDKTIDLPENQRIRQVSSVGFADFWGERKRYFRKNSNGQGDYVVVAG